MTTFNFYLTELFDAVAKLVIKSGLLSKQGWRTSWLQFKTPISKEYVIYWGNQNSIPQFGDQARLAKKYLSVENSPYGKEREIQVGSTYKEKDPFS